MGYEVIHTATDTVICDGNLKVRVSEGQPVAGTAFGLGTLYRDHKGFTPVKVYLFQAVTNIDAESLKKLAVFFFASLLDTELYVLEIPRDSTLFPQEAQRIFGHYDHERAI